MVSVIAWVNLFDFFTLNYSAPSCQQEVKCFTPSLKPPPVFPAYSFQFCSVMSFSPLLSIMHGCKGSLIATCGFNFTVVIYFFFFKSSYNTNIKVGHGFVSKSILALNWASPPLFMVYMSYPAMNEQWNVLFQSVWCSTWCAAISSSLMDLVLQQHVGASISHNGTNRGPGGGIVRSVVCL